MGKLLYVCEKQNIMTDAERKQELLKQIIIRLSRQEDAGELVREFNTHYHAVSMEDIVASSRDLEQEGIKVKDYAQLEKELFDLIKEKLPESRVPELPAGHPVQTFREENRVILKLMDEADRLASQPESFSRLHSDWLLLARNLGEINKHYLRKENQLFPFLEKYGFTHPSTVMWAVHDEIRKMIKMFTGAVEQKDENTALIVLDRLTNEIRDMVQKEEMILLPTALKLLQEEDWQRIRQGEEEIGYALIDPPAGSGQKVSAPTATRREEAGGDVPEETVTVPGFGETGQFAPPVGAIMMNEGYLTPQQLDLIFRHLPFDVTFVNEKDEVVYYNKGEERVFPRSPGIIGRQVKYCHPPKSVDTVLRILEAFRSGEKDRADFWINMDGRFVFIQYFAVRDTHGHYRGVLEVTYDATRIRSLEGEQRLLDWHQ